ncbi:MAG: hypothetical protein AAF513_17560 [Pseudomonadota bacterium]
MALPTDHPLREVLGECLAPVDWADLDGLSPAALPELNLSHLFCFASLLCRRDFPAAWSRLGGPLCVVLNGGNADEYNIPQARVRTVLMLRTTFLLDGRVMDADAQIAIHDGDGATVPTLHSGRLVVTHQQTALITPHLGYLAGDGRYIELAQGQHGGGPWDIWAGELERVLLRRATVADAAVLVASPSTEASPGAAPEPELTVWVQPEEGERSDALHEVALLDDLQGRLAGFKHPQDIHFCAAIPRDRCGFRDYMALRSATIS